MKNIFKKNQIIITALAIMIAIAGYLNFSGRNDKDKIADVGSSEVLDYDTYTETAGDDLLDGDTVSLDADVADANSLENADLTADGNTSEDVATGTENTDDASQAAVSDENADDTQVADNQEDDADVTDISDEDVAGEEIAKLDVTDTGEVVAKKADASTADDKADAADEETSAPGEAILVSTTISPNFFASAKLTREQTRSRNKELLMELVDSTNITEKEKEEAINSVINLTAIAEKENATETLLEAKGFSDAVVSITEGNVDVIINTASVTEQDIAQVEDIVKRKTGAPSSEIHISAVTVEE